MKRKAFTLAEVLITLDIIGIVAAMTLPELIEYNQEIAQITALKLAYSQINAAISQAAFEYGTVDTWGKDVTERREKLKEILPKYLKVVKICEKGKRDAGCLAKEYTSNLSDTFSGGKKLPLNIYGYGDSMILANGISLLFEENISSGDCTYTAKGFNLDVSRKKEDWTKTCLSFTVDTNGPGKPNAASEDWFGFYLVKDGIVPTGTSGSDNWSWVLTFSNNCLGNGPFAITYQTNCTAWVLAFSNMDYKRCPEKLGWDKVHSCKGN